VNNKVVMQFNTNGTVQLPGGTIASNLVASKAANTNRNTVTAVAADPDLAFASLATGIYALQAYIQCQSSAGGGGGLKLTLGNSSGTMTGSYAYVGGIAGAFVDAVGQSQLNGLTAFTGISNAAPVDWLEITGQLIVTVAGAFSFQWAQNSSSAVNTEILAGSWIQLTKVG
jgi:hypothetical protein